MENILVKNDFTKVNTSFTIHKTKSKSMFWNSKAMILQTSKIKTKMEMLQRKNDLNIMQQYQQTLIMTITLFSW